MQHPDSQLASLPDSTLLQKTETLAAEERRITLSVLHHLAEVDRRLLWARESYPSLFEFCVKRLKYTEAQTQRRISAMRLLSRVPEVESKIASGEIKVSQLAQVQTFIRAEKKESGRKVTQEETRKILGSLAGKSTRESERLLLSLSPGLQSQKKAEERIRPLTDTQTEIRFTIDAETLSLLEEAKALIAHNRQMNPRTAELLKAGLKLLIAEKKKERRLDKTAALTKECADGRRSIQREQRSPRRSLAERQAQSAVPTLAERQARSGAPLIRDAPPSRTSLVAGQVIPAGASLVARPAPSARQEPPDEPLLATRQVDARHHSPGLRQLEDSSHALAQRKTKPPANRSRYILVDRKRQAFVRAGDRCEFTNAQGIRCSSRRALELHHRVPYARGGANTLGNLQVYCKGHNQAQGRWDFPQSK